MKLPENDLFQLLVENSEESMLVTDQSNTILYINNSAKHLLSLENHAPNPIKLSNLLPFKKIESDFRGRKVLRWNNRLLSVRTDKTQVEHKKVTLWYLEDITELHQQEDELYCLHTIVDSINEGILVTDPQGRIVIYNKQIAKYEGLSPSQVLGKHLTDVYDVSAENSEHLTVHRTHKPIVDLNQNYVTSAGKKMHLVASTCPVIKEDRVIFVYSICRNVTTIHQLLAKTIELQTNLLPADQKNSFQNGTKFTFGDIVGESKALQGLITEAKKSAQSASPVLLHGETGTGKELFAQSIHNAGPGKNEPFVAINCAAIPDTLLESLLFGTVKGAFTGAENTKGLFEQAGQGTLFLDEINSMSVNLQAKLLRVLQEKSVRSIGANAETPVKCRIISSTNTDPWQCVINKSLRKDLYFRLAVISLSIPPLKERENDVEILALYFIQKYNRIYGKQLTTLTRELQQVLLQHNWPGNVRELEHALESAITMAEDDEELSLHHLPSYLRYRFSQNNTDFSPHTNVSGNLGEILLETEKKVIVNTLKNHGGNISQAAKSIGIGRQNLQYRIRKLNIDKKSPSGFSVDI